MVETTNIAFLRGINVGGKHRLPMADLRSMFEAAGASTVRTLLQSGNVVFTCGAAEVVDMVAAVERAIATELDFEAPIATRTVDEVEAALSACPFVEDDPDGKSVLVGFLLDAPDATRVAALDPERSPPDRFEVIGREIHLSCPNGVARSRCTNAWFDRSIGSTSTFRNLATLRRVLEVARS